MLEANTKTWQCRIAPSLGGGFAGTPNEVWGTLDYEDPTAPTVFFGLYGLNDLHVLWKHRGEKAILWAGSDIRHFTSGYWLDEIGEFRIDVPGVARWINHTCENYVENSVEAQALEQVGIIAHVVPSFLGNIDDYEVQEPPTKAQYYTTVSGNDYELYGWDQLWTYAKSHPNVEFHCYGNTDNWTLHYPNVFVHGRVSQAEMNEQIKGMTGALRLTRFDGFSEILAKSVLWGQYPVSPHIPYPHIDSHITLPRLKPNYEARDYYRQKLNDYPWNVKKH